MRKLTAWLVRVIVRRSGHTENLRADVARWREALRLPARAGGPEEDIVRLFDEFPEFRALFFYRIGRGRRSVELLHRLCPPMPTLFIHTQNIGPGLFLQHAFATIIGASSIGRNCWINQNVTIGYSDAVSCPEIGDDVTINAGAIVLGAIRIGHGAKIGAGAVVTTSVPDGCTVAGNPARIVYRKPEAVEAKSTPPS